MLGTIFFKSKERNIREIYRLQIIKKNYYVNYEILYKI